MASMRWKNATAAAKVVGPIRCHRCSAMCRDASHYLSHKCGSQSQVSPFSGGPKQ
jgi:hypothetical protein